MLRAHCYAIFSHQIENICKLKKFDWTVEKKKTKNRAAAGQVLHYLAIHGPWLMARGWCFHRNCYLNQSLSMQCTTTIKQMATIHFFFPESSKLRPFFGCHNFYFLHHPHFFYHLNIRWIKKKQKSCNFGSLCVLLMNEQCSKLGSKHTDSHKTL